jgi:hypothetical protein
MGSARIAHPTGIEAHVDDELFSLWPSASVAVVEEKTPAGTHWVLAQVALGPAGSLVMFDDVIALAVRASNGDQYRAKIKFISCPREGTYKTGHPL